jgi:hypothetical protein
MTTQAVSCIDPSAQKRRLRMAKQVWSCIDPSACKKRRPQDDKAQLDCEIAAAHGQLRPLHDARHLPAFAVATLKD